ncbi:hypothetical protein C8R45DRAFT_933605 [Mycena sanguinolenta]|nr:hypothetical protein C8R45DRAFT_933605 [Mycena sanguinolenta]
MFWKRAPSSVEVKLNEMYAPGHPTSSLDEHNDLRELGSTERTREETGTTTIVGGKNNHVAVLHNEESNGNEARFLMLKGYGEKVKQVCEQLRACGESSDIQACFGTKKLSFLLGWATTTSILSDTQVATCAKAAATTSSTSWGLEAVAVTELVLDSPDRHNYLTPSPSQELQGLHAPRQPHCANVVMNHSSRRPFLTASFG